MIFKLQKTWNRISEQYPLLLFYLVVLVITLLYYYHILLLSPPQSIHRWRQTDSASITLNMYQHGMHFFKPEVHSLTSDDFTTGYAAAEAPLLYYLIALLYKLFGPHDYIYRIVNTLIFMIGLGALFKISQHYLRDFIASAFVPLFIFASPVVAYYGNNFLTDSTSLALVFIGWWQYIRYLNTNRYSIFVFAVIMFTMAGLLKATMTLNLFALCGLAFLWQFRLMRENGKQLLLRSLGTLSPLFFGLAIIVGWYAYAVWFNRQHESSTFLTSITPWWKITFQQRHEITQHIINNNLTLYYSSGARCFFGVTTLIFIGFFKHLPKFPGIASMLLFIGAVIYVNLYYNQFQYHDYYILILFSPVAFVFLSSLIVIKSRFQRFFTSWYFRLFLILMLVINVFHARQEMKLRYFGWKRETPVLEAHFTIQPYLRSIGVKAQDRVISMPDYTNCYTLYLMNQPGNNLGDIGPSTQATIQKLINKGARYLVINDTTFLRHPDMLEFLKYKAGEYQQIEIFRIDTCLKNENN